MCTPKQIGWQLVDVYLHFDLVAFSPLTNPEITSPEILSGSHSFHLRSVSLPRCLEHLGSRVSEYKPRTKMFFSGNLLPLATLSNMDDHIPFLDSSLLLGLEAGSSMVDVCTVLVEYRAASAISDDSDQQPHVQFSESKLSSKSNGRLSNMALVFEGGY